MINTTIAQRISSNMITAPALYPRYAVPYYNVIQFHTSCVMLMVLFTALYVIVINTTIKVIAHVYIFIFILLWELSQ